MWIAVEKVEPSSFAALSAGLQGEHSLDVPAHRHQIPLAFDVGESSQEKLGRFDDAEYRFGGLFAQRVELSSPRSLEPMRHLVHRRGRVGRGSWGAAAKRCCQPT
jgi:hypothetical protein